MVVVLLARCLDHFGEQDRGEQLLEEVLAEDPHFPPASGDRGQLAMRKGQLAEAETWLREALALDPRARPWRYQLIQCLYKSGKSAEAAVEEERLKKLEANLTRLDTITTQEMPQRPHDLTLKLELGQILLELGEIKEGLYWLNEALRQNPACVPAHRSLAAFFQRRGDRARAAHHRRFLPEATPSGTTAPIRTGTELEG
jgi:predicted Zn-dependent protease